MIARLGTGNYHNAARNLHKFVRKNGKTLPIPISSCNLPVKEKRTTREKVVPYPYFKLSSWLEFLLGSCGSEFVLGGYDLHKDAMQYEAMFGRFWDRFRSADPLHPVYNKSSLDLTRCIPFCLHGDEGRGLCKIPVMIESFQPCMPWMGEDHLNTLGCHEWLWVIVSILAIY